MGPGLPGPLVIELVLDLVITVGPSVPGLHQPQDDHAAVFVHDGVDDQPAPPPLRDVQDYARHRDARHPTLRPLPRQPRPQRRLRRRRLPGLTNWHGTIGISCRCVNHGRRGGRGSRSRGDRTSGGPVDGPDDRGNRPEHRGQRGGEPRVVQGRDRHDHDENDGEHREDDGLLHTFLLCEWCTPEQIHNMHIGCQA